MEGNLRFKIDWASLTVEGKFTVFALFYFVFEGNIPSPRGDLTGVLIFSLPVRWGGSGGGGGAYTWRGLFSEFYGIPFYLALGNP